MPEFCVILSGIFRPRSSMDRMSDSGSDDLGSSPDGVTITLYLFDFDYHNKILG